MRVQSSPPSPSFSDFPKSAYGPAPSRPGASHHITILGMILALVIVDIAMATLSLAMAFELRFTASVIPAVEQHAWQDYLVPALAQCILFPAVFLWQGLYQFRRNVSRIDELQRVFSAVSIATVITWSASFFFARDLTFSRGVVVLAWPLAILLVWAGRVVAWFLFALLLRRGVAQERVLIIGAGEMARFIIQKIRNQPGWGYRMVGVATTTPVNFEAVESVPVLGPADDIEHLIATYALTEVIFADPSISRKDLLDLVTRCDRSQVSIRVLPDTFELMSGGVTVSDFNGLPMFSIRDAALRGINRTLKRVVDIVVSGMIVVMLSPGLLLLAIIVKLTSGPGPVFYSQERVGLDGRIFSVLKFRSMRQDAEAQSGPVWARKGDPRTTLLGGFMRRFSVDELPQFVNVLTGDMSIVGPRPERPHFVAQFSQAIPRYGDRHREKAGLTGWAQVNGLRGNTSIEERTAYDLWYVENWSLWLDFKIMLRTIVAVFRDSNG